MTHRHSSLLTLTDGTQLLHLTAALAGSRLLAVTSRCASANPPPPSTRKEKHSPSFHPSRFTVEADSHQLYVAIPNPSFNLGCSNCVNALRWVLVTHSRRLIGFKRGQRISPLSHVLLIKSEVFIIFLQTQVAAATALTRFLQNSNRID